MLNQAVKEGRIPSHPGLSADRPRPAQQDRPRLRRHEAARILAAAEAEGGSQALPLPALAIALALELGLRENEIASLRWIDLPGGEIRVRRQTLRVDGRLLESDLKGHQERTIPLPPGSRIAAVLDPRIARAHSITGGQRHVFPHRTRPEAPVHPRTVYGWLQRLLARAGRRELQQAAAEGREPRQLPRLQFHDLRSIAISNLRADGLDPYIIARIVGHEKISTTEAHYLAHDVDDIAQALLQPRRQDPGQSA